MITILADATMNILSGCDAISLEPNYIRVSRVIDLTSGKIKPNINAVNPVCIANAGRFGFTYNDTDDIGAFAEYDKNMYFAYKDNNKDNITDFLKVFSERINKGKYMLHAEYLLNNQPGGVTCKVTFDAFNPTNLSIDDLRAETFGWIESCRKERVFRHYDTDMKPQEAAIKDTTTNKFRIIVSMINCDKKQVLDLLDRQLSFLFDGIIKRTKTPIGGSSIAASHWKKTAQKVLVGHRHLTVYRNSSTRELRVRRLIMGDDGRRRASYVKP